VNPFFDRGCIVKDFRDMQVWHKAHQVVTSVYKLTQKFPTEEKYGLTSQIRRAAVSIPTNIAEGCGQTSNAQFARYLTIAFGSACELEYLCLLAKDLSYTTEKLEMLNEVKAMLAALIRKVSPLPTEC
jgi:four helix bundle protein